MVPGAIAPREATENAVTRAASLIPRRTVPKHQRLLSEVAPSNFLPPGTASSPSRWVKLPPKVGTEQTTGAARSHWILENEAQVLPSARAISNFPKPPSAVHFGQPQQAAIRPSSAVPAQRAVAPNTAPIPAVLPQRVAAANTAALPPPPAARPKRAVTFADLPPPAVRP